MTLTRKPPSLLALLLFVALSTVVPLASAQTASASDGTHHVHTFNMCGNLCVNMEGHLPRTTPLQAVNLAVSQVTLDDPLAIGVQEICYGTQWPNLSYRLAQAGYTGAFYPARRNVANCGDFGNAIFTVARPTIFPYGTYQSQAPDGELRGYVCAQFTPYVPMMACSSHLVGGESVYTRNQAAEYTYAVAFRSVGRCQLAVGDLNLRPTNSALQPFYDGFWEGNSRNNKPVTTDDGLAYDYVFAEADQFLHVRPNAALSTNSSDHHYYEGRWTPPNNMLRPDCDFARRDDAIEGDVGETCEHESAAAQPRGMAG